MGRFIHFALAAATEAVEMSGLKVTPENAENIGVYVGSGIGGFDVIEREHTALMEGGPRKISPFFIPASIVNLAAGQVSIRFGAKGPNLASATACTTGAHAIGDSFKIIQRGDADVMIAGGAEAAITPMSVGGFCSMRALSTRNQEPERASRPWDKDRDGFVVGEGAGILVLEELEHAKARGARIHAEVAGYGMSGDAYHITAPAPGHDGAFRVMRNAIRDAKLTPADIGYVNAHGTSTPIGDELEAMAIRNLFGEYNVPVSSTKSMTGHLLGGAGGLEAGITVLALREQTLPPTTNLENQEETHPGHGFRTEPRPQSIAELCAVEFLRFRGNQRVIGFQALERVAVRTCNNGIGKQKTRERGFRFRSFFFRCHGLICSRDSRLRSSTNAQS